MIRRPAGRAALLALVPLVASMVLAACGSGDDAPAAGSSAGASTTPQAGTLIVFAAASLNATFTQIGADFSKANPGTKVTFSFAGSSDLVANLVGGAPADVFASADTATMTKATDANLVDGKPVDFATNTMTIVTPPDNPAGIASFADLAKAGVDEVICQAQVPCGAATKKIEDTTGVTLSPVSEELSVTDVLGKVENGADAGVVYVTDAKGAGGRVATVPIPTADNAVNTYPIATLEGSTQPGLAAKFVAYVAGPDGQKVLAAAGFAPAP